MYPCSFSSKYPFPHGLTLLGRPVSEIQWSTILGKCDTTMETVVQSLPGESFENIVQIMQFLEERITEPMSLCSLVIQTDCTRIAIDFQEKRLIFFLPQQEVREYWLDIPDSDSPALFMRSPEAVLRACEAAFTLLPATTPEAAERRVEKLNIFSNNLLTPITP